MSRTAGSRDILNQRADAFVEHTEYRDTGCSEHPACLSCPLPQCVEDAWGSAFKRRKEAERVRVVELAAAGKTRAEIAFEVNRSLRVVQRILSQEARR